MINWIIIIILVIAGIFAIKMNHLRHRIFIIAIILVALFFYLTVTFVATKNNVNMNSYDGFVNGMSVYSGWLANGFQNVKAIAGNAIKMDWTSTNATFFSKNTKNTNSKSASGFNKASVTLHK